MGSPSAISAVVVVAAVLVATQSEALFRVSEDAETTDVDERGYEVADDDDILEDMFDYVIGENDVTEGRKKKYKKKYIKYLAAAVLLKAILLPKLLALVKFLIAKAYLLSLLALVAAAAVSSKKKEHDTEQVINLLPKMGTAGRHMGGQEQAYRYWRRRRFVDPEPEDP